MVQRVRVEKVHYFDDFEEGQSFEHHWGKTVTDGDNSLFTSLTMNANPTYSNADLAGDYGYDDVVVDPLFAFNLVLGLSVQDLSEAGGAFLEVSDLEFHRPVYPGDTLYAESEVVSTRESESRPHQGIVTWHTIGRRSDDSEVLEYDRTNLVNKREGAGADGEPAR